jgi:undecaprenyl-diphosphatase
LLATLLGHFHPKVRVLLFSLAFFASFLRIYQGVHYPSDLLGGALLGIGIGIFFLRYKKGILDLLKGILK